MNKPNKSSQSNKNTTEEILFQFQYKPKDIKEYLDKYVIQQNEAKKALSIAICDHYNHVMDYESNPSTRQENYTKHNIILVGPTGVGKTYLVRTIAKLIGVPFVKADATKFSETGYVGGNVEDLVRDLVTQANGDIKLASYGIIYLDEIDKIASSSSPNGRDISGRGVQMGLLKLMEETEVNVRSPFDMESHIHAIFDQQQGKASKQQLINTRHILFIVSGAFNGLQEIIKKRLNKQRLGFSTSDTSIKDEHYLLSMRSQDFTFFGFEPEFIGRLPIHVACKDLAEDDLYDILKYSQGTIIKQYTKAFQAYGITIYFSDSGLKSIAHKAFLEKTGARGLVTVCEKILRDFKFELSSIAPISFVVTKELVENANEVLQKLLENKEFHNELIILEKLISYEENFYEKYGFYIFLDDLAKNYLQKHISNNDNVAAFCDQIFQTCKYGFDLIINNTRTNKFTITKSFVENPSSVLATWIKESYTPTDSINKNDNSNQDTIEENDLKTKDVNLIKEPIAEISETTQKQILEQEYTNPKIRKKTSKSNSKKNLETIATPELSNDNSDDVMKKTPKKTSTKNKN